MEETVSVANNNRTKTKPTPPPIAATTTQHTATTLTMSFIAKLASPSFYTGAVANMTKRAQNYYHPLIRQNR
jgi:hypothetical protein